MQPHQSPWRNAAPLPRGDWSRTMSHLKHNHQSRESRNWLEQERSQGRKTRKSARYLFRFHFQHSRTKEKIPWPSGAEIWLESQLLPMSDLGQVTSPPPPGLGFPIYKLELPPQAPPCPLLTASGKGSNQISTSSAGLSKVPTVCSSLYQRGDRKKTCLTPAPREARAGSTDPRKGTLGYILSQSDCPAQGGGEEVVSCCTIHQINCPKWEIYRPPTASCVSHNLPCP